MRTEKRKRCTCSLIITYLLRDVMADDVTKTKAMECRIPLPENPFLRRIETTIISKRMQSFIEATVQERAKIDNRKHVQVPGEEKFC